MSTPTPADARVIKWSDLPVDRPLDLIERRRIMGVHAMISRVDLKKGFRLGTHHHANEQFACVLSGRARFVLHEGTPRERAVTLGPGEVLHLPPNVPHAAEALEDCVIWDIFSPVSEKTGVDRA